MAYETKVINTMFLGANEQEIINFNSCFGWQTICVASNRITMNRDKNINKYTEIVEQENNYKVEEARLMKLCSKLRTLRLITPILLILTIFLAGIFLLIVASKYKKEIAKSKVRMSEISIVAYKLFYENN